MRTTLALVLAFLLGMLARDLLPSIARAIEDGARHILQTVLTKL